MVYGMQMNNLVLVVLLLSLVCDSTASFSTTASRCSWGTWSQWNCTCCGNTVNQPVYRVRPKCCPGTFACGNLRIMVDKITSTVTDFLETGNCMDDCHESFRSLSTTKSSLPSRQQPPKTTVTHRDSTRMTDADVRSSTHAPLYSSHDTVPAENVTTKYSNKDSDRTLSTTKSSLPSHQQPTKTTVTHRDSTRVTDADVRSSTHAPLYSSHDTVQAENVTTKYSIKDSDKNIASRFTVSSGPVLWIAVVFTTVLCLLDLTPI